MKSEPTTLDQMWDWANTALTRGVRDRKHPARHPVLATIGPHGPEQRVLVLRGWDGASLRLQTDAATAKVQELSADPRCSLHVWVPRHALQLRLTARAALTHGSPDEWDAMPEHAREVYGGTPTPGTPMTKAEDFAPGAELGRYMILTLTCSRMDVLHLGPNMHRRALFSHDADGWHGTWTAP